MSRSAVEWEKQPSLPKEDYVSSEIYRNAELFKEELSRLKRATWKFACHESEIPELNDYRTLNHAGVPVIVTRSSDGNIRAFINSCSHRSALVLREASGNAKQWTCLFHMWSYNNRGDCVHISREDGYAESGIGKEKMGLREIRVAEKYGLVFINLDDNAQPFDEFVGDAFEIIADVLSGAKYEVFHYHKAFVNANWKQWHETNMELYHEYLHYVNRQVAMSNKEFFERKWKLYPNGHASLTPMHQKYERVKGWTERDEKPLPGLTPGEFRILACFPDTTIICRTTAMRIDTSTPIEPGVTLVEQRGLGIKGESDADRRMRVNHHNQFWGPFGRNFPEDGIAVEVVDQAIRSGEPRYTIFARHEEGRAQDDAVIRAYYREWERYMGRSASQPLQRSAAER